MEGTTAISNQYLLFMLHGQIFALPTSSIIEIVQKNAITDIPERPDYVLGIVDLRGEVIPIIDAGLRVGGEAIAETARNCIIILNKDDAVHVGLLVDDVVSVHDIDSGDITPPPTFAREYEEVKPFIRGITKVEAQLVLLLDSCELLSEIQVKDLIPQ